MNARHLCQPAVLALALAGLAPAARALDIVFTDVGATAMSGEQFSAFRSAADFWQSKLTDNVTVYVSIGFADLGGNTLGSTTWAQSQVSYGNLRSLLAADAMSAADASAVSHLQSGPALSFLATQANLATRLDHDGSLNNTQLNLTTANAKALGLGTSTNATNPDAVIRFSNSYASTFAYNRAVGASFDKIDFVTLAEHEIGHALGFVSGVDSIDGCIGQTMHCGLASGLEGRAWYYPLDLFRFSAPGAMDVTVGGSPYFSLDDGATLIQPFSSGRNQGDGNQASHFKDGFSELMGPYVHYGSTLDASAADLLALDAIGWNVSTAAVPEPQAWALLAGGLGVIAWARRRRG